MKQCTITFFCTIKMNPVYLTGTMTLIVESDELNTCLHIYASRTRKTFSWFDLWLQSVTVHIRLVYSLKYFKWFSTRIYAKSYVFPLKFSYFYVMTKMLNVNLNLCFLYIQSNLISYLLFCSFMRNLDRDDDMILQLHVLVVGGWMEKVSEWWDGGIKKVKRSKWWRFAWV